MLSTHAPELIYDAFSRQGLLVLRIDNFDRGNYAEIRIELDVAGGLTIEELQRISVKLQLIERNEGIRIEVVHLDMIHKTLRVNIHTRGESEEEKRTRSDSNAQPAD